MYTMPNIDAAQAVLPPAPAIHFSEVTPYGTAWQAQGCWRSLAGSLIVQWRDPQQAHHYEVVLGTDDPKAAMQAYVDSATAPIIDSTCWGDYVVAFRVRTPSELASEWGLCAEDIAAAYEAGDDTALDEVDTLGITWQPSEPPCAEDEGHMQHSWRDGIVRCSGGGVIYTDTCRHCGMERTTDTWAQDPNNGSEGHTSVSYSEDGINALCRPGEVE